jgi:lysophospholipase L1-like esterase
MGKGKRMRVVGRRYAGLVVAMAALSLAAWSSSGPAGAATKAKTEYYVSVGDSYGAGYQPISSALHHRDTNGFAYQVVGLAKKKGYHLELRNFACDGATTTSAIQHVGCALPSPGPDAVSYPTTTQAVAAERFVSAHQGQVGLITLSLGGNDLFPCSSAKVVNTCVTRALPTIKSNLLTLVAGLRRAAGPKVPIIGTTYPDVFLGLYTSTDQTQGTSPKVTIISTTYPDVLLGFDTSTDQTMKNLAILSVSEFRSLFNPALRAVYTSVGADFVDVTKATGGYTPLTVMTHTSKYGTVPVAVADVCALTYYCSQQDIHPTTAGYSVIARLIVGALPKLG